MFKLCIINICNFLKILKGSECNHLINKPGHKKKSNSMTVNVKK